MHSLRKAPVGSDHETPPAEIALFRLLRRLTKPVTQRHVPHLTWRHPVVHVSRNAVVVDVQCFRDECMCCSASNHRVAACHRGHERNPRPLVAKIFSAINTRRIAVRSVDGDSRVHWVVLSGSEDTFVLCDAFALEAVVSALLCEPGRCWQHHLPVLLESFAQPMRDLGVLVSSHEGTPLLHWLATAETAAVQAIIFQIAAALFALQRHLLFAHNDLHVFNVLVTKSRPRRPGPPPSHLLYDVGGMRFWVPFFDGLCARVIDFQFAAVRLGRGRGVQVLRADVFVGQTATPTGAGAGPAGGAWNPLLQGQWGQDLATLTRSMQRSLSHKHPCQAFLSKCFQALDMTATSSGSRVKPCVFLQRVFGGSGKSAAVDFTRRRPSTMGSDTTPTLRCGRTSRQ